MSREQQLRDSLSLPSPKPVSSSDDQQVRVAQHNWLTLNQIISKLTALWKADVAHLSARIADNEKQILALKQVVAGVCQSNTLLLKPV